MSYKLPSNIASIVLSAGKGSRLGSVDVPKVLFPLSGKPMLSYTVDTLSFMGFGGKDIVLVVGFKKEKIKEYFKNKVSFSEQKYKLGTAHATYCGIRALGREKKHILVLGGDDSAFYTADTLLTFVNNHVDNGGVLSLLSVEVDDPSLLGRVVRTSDGALLKVVEKENVTKQEKLIREVSTGTFCFDREWFETIYPNMPILSRLGEYGLPTAIDMARNEDKKINVMKIQNAGEWFGVNTPEQLLEAERRMNLRLS